MSWPLPDGAHRHGAGAAAVSGRPRRRAGAASPNWAYVDEELRRKGVTRSLLWQEYRADHPDGYGYAWFCEHYDAWKQRTSPTMRQRHGAGEKVFVDFAGDTIDVIDPVTGAPRR